MARLTGGCRLAGPPAQAAVRLVPALAPVRALRVRAEGVARAALRAVSRRWLGRRAAVARAAALVDGLLAGGLVAAAAALRQLDNLLQGFRVLEQVHRAQLAARLGLVAHCPQAAAQRARGVPRLQCRP